MHATPKWVLWQFQSVIQKQYKMIKSFLNEFLVSLWFFKCLRNHQNYTPTFIILCKLNCMYKEIQIENFWRGTFLLLTERTPQPVGMSANELANTSRTESDVNDTATLTPATNAKNTSPWKRRITNWKLADNFGLIVNTCQHQNSHCKSSVTMMTAIPSEYEALFGFEKDQTFSSIHGRTLTKRHRSCKNPKNGSQGQCTVVTFDQFSEDSRLSKTCQIFSSNSMAEIVYIFFGIWEGEHPKSKHETTKNHEESTSKTHKKTPFHFDINIFSAHTHLFCS